MIPIDNLHKDYSTESITIGVSSCLVGKKVRFDAGHRQNWFVTSLLADHFKLVLVCPEIEVGMGVPRETVRLVGDEIAPRMVGTRTEADWTIKMNRYCEERVKKNDVATLSGFILKKNSPSCGLARVKLHLAPRNIRRKATGLFARALLERYPDCPVEEESRLADPALRENFIERVFAYKRLQMMYARPFKRGDMIRFHENHKYQLLAHSPQHYRLTGQLVAKVREFTPTEFKKQYQSLFMTTLKLKATVKKSVNVLRHIAGFLKRELSALGKRDIQQAIDNYQQQLVPLVVPLTLLSHLVNRFGIEYIQNQSYMNPHPGVLMLRNHV